jgi:hypothetical protein
MAPAATGLQGACDVWVEEPRRAGTPVAVAVASDALTALRAMSVRGARVVSVQPWWSEVLRAAVARQPRPVAMSIQDCDSVTILLGEGDDFEVMSTVAPVQDAESARMAFARAALSSSVEVREAFNVVLRLDREPDTDQTMGKQGHDMALSCLAEMTP